MLVKRSVFFDYESAKHGLGPTIRGQIVTLEQLPEENDSMSRLKEDVSNENGLNEDMLPL